MLAERVIDRLKEILGASAVLTSAEDRLFYSYDATMPEYLPDAVVFPLNTEHVQQVLRLANELKIPLVPRGAGTNLSGGSLPVNGGIVLCLTKMARILEIDQENLTAVVEPGVVNAHLQIAVASYGLFYPPDPASMNVCTLGGNVAECSGGPRCLKYGVTRDYVLGLEIVLANGEIIHTGGRVVKNVTGYDLTRLFIGSEGTLGVVTKIILRLLPLPEAKKTLLAIFDHIGAAGAAVSAIIAAGIVPTTLELMDNLLIQCAEDFVSAGLPRDAQAVLLIEVDGFAESLDRQVQQIETICRQNMVREVRQARTAKEVDDLWLARRSVIGAVARLRPSYHLQDITVPRSQLPAIIAKIGEISQKYGLPIGNLAHAGDGNLHPLILFDKRNKDEVARVQFAEREIFAAALEMGGTLSGEHGIGLEKRDYLPLAYSPLEMHLTREIKRLFDPNNILNPHKIV
ncbi:MAG: FAD-binding protein [Chloroflexi bacterium]|nr:FAD-binding protein [Chloroflexota bacterium]MCL5076375.1 FAD-binding protein [Chloroflexota bacterium]